MLGICVEIHSIRIQVSRFERRGVALTSNKRITRAFSPTAVLMPNLRLFIWLLLLCWFGVTTSIGQATQDYDALIQQGKTQLQAGNNDAAGSMAAAAIKLNPDQWEAYALAGGVMINRKNCEAANHFLAAALKRAPAEKRTGIQNLMNECTNPVQATSGNTAPSSGPTLRETSDWLAKTLKAYGGLYLTNGLLESAVTDAEISNDCTLQIKSTHYDWNFDKRKEKSSWVVTETVPLGAVTSVRLDVRSDLNEVTIYTYPVSAVLVNNRGSQAPTFQLGIDLQRRPDESLGTDVPQTGSEISQRVEKALSHAVDLCRGTYSHPQSKEPF